MTNRDAAQKYLEKQHTRQLIKMRDKVYAVSNIGMDIGRIGRLDVTDTLSVTSLEIKRELATREHVPNTAEAKLIRQQRAKEKKNR